MPRPSRQRVRVRQVALFVISMFVPSLVLLAMGARLIVQQDELSEKHAADAQRLQLADFERNVATRLDALRQNANDASVVLVATLSADRIILPWDHGPVEHSDPHFETARTTAELNGSASAIETMAATGGDAHEIHRASDWNDASRYNTLAWRPDQKFLLFARGGLAPNTPNVLWRVPAGGGAAAKVGVAVAGNFKSPAVRPDGRTLLFVIAGAQDNEI